MAVGVSNMIQRVRQILGDTPHFDKNTSDPGTATAGDTDTFDVADTTEYAEGNVLEFQDDGEQVLVKALTDADTLTVYRGHNGTTPAAHTAGVRLAKNPVWSFYDIKESIRAALETLWPYVYRQVDDTVTLVSNTQWYEIDSAIFDLSQVTQIIDSNPDYPFFYGAKGPVYPVGMRRNLPTAFIATGVGLYVPFQRDTTTIYVTGIGKVDDTQSGGNYSYIEDGTMADMVVYGTVSRLAASHDISRTFGEDTTMHDASVKPGDRLRSGAYYESKYREIRNQMQMELEGQLPRMKKSGRPDGMENIMVGSVRF